MRDSPIICCIRQLCLICLLIELILWMAAFVLSQWQLLSPPMMESPNSQETIYWYLPLSNNLFGPYWSLVQLGPSGSGWVLAHSTGDQSFIWALSRFSVVQQVSHWFSHLQGFMHLLSHLWALLILFWVWWLLLDLPNPIHLFATGVKKAKVGLAWMLN